MFLQLCNYNNSASTYLLRKQAAAVEGGNRREEAETKGTGGFRGRQWTNRERERDGGGRREGEEERSY